MRMIDANSAKEALECTLVGDAAALAQRVIDRMPTIEAVPVVRCRECKHKNTKKCPMVIVNFNSDMEEMLVQNHVSDDFFCSYGEQKDGNSNG